MKTRTKQKLIKTAATLTFLIPLANVPNALAAATPPEVMTLFPNTEYSNSDVQHFTVVFDRFIPQATQNMIQFDGSAMNCQVQPFNHGGVSFDIAIENCSDGDLKIEVLPNAIQDSDQNLGPTTETWSNYTQISRAIPTFEVTQVNPLGPTTLEFHLTSNFGIWLPNDNALSFGNSGCQIAGSNFSNADIWYYLDECTPDTDFQIALGPYSLTDMFHNAGPAELLLSESINLQATTPVEPPINPGTPTPDPTATTNASPSPGQRSLATKPWIRPTPGTETGATQVPIPTPTETPTTKPTKTPEKQEPVIAKPKDQDPPEQRQVKQIEKPRPTYAPIQIEKANNTNNENIIGLTLITISAAIAIAVFATQLRRNRRVRRTRIAIS